VWAPELFSAPTLERLQHTWELKQVDAVPYYAGLMSGEHDALIQAFAGQPILHDPRRGRVIGVPAFEAYGNGDSERAVALFLSHVSGLPWAACRTTIEKGAPGAVAQAVKDADTFFGVELPALAQWEFGAEQAADVSQPVLSVLGSTTEQLWVEVDQFLRSSLPHVESCTVPGVGHLLHGQHAEPVARVMADFFGRHPLS